MNYEYEASIVKGIVLKHFEKARLLHGKLEDFFIEFSRISSSVSVVAIDIFSTPGENQEYVANFDSNRDVVNVVLTFLLKKSDDNFEMLEFYLHAHDYGDPTYELTLNDIISFNIPIAERLEELSKNQSNACVREFVNDFSSGRGYGRYNIRDTYSLNFEGLEKINDATTWIKAFVNDNGRPSKRFTS